MLKELTHRGSNGIDVWWLWDSTAKHDPVRPEFQIKVTDIRPESSAVFTLYRDDFHSAKEAYYHPFAAARQELKSGKVAA
jgi:hypothetical protein